MKKLLLALLLCAPLAAFADATFFWRAENSTTLSAGDDLSPDTSASATGGVSFSNSVEKVGTYGILTTNNADFYTFDPTGICDAAQGTLAGWMQWKTAVPASGNTIIAACHNTGDSSRAQITSGASQEFRMTLQSSGGTTLNLVTTACNAAVDTWYFVVASWHIANDDRTIACYDTSGTLINKVTDTSTDLSTGAPASFDEFRVANIGTNANPIWVDNIFASATYAEPFENFHSITSYTPTYTGAPTLGTATSTSLPFTYTADQDGTTYAAACTDGQTIATVAAVISGTCSGGAAIGTANDNATATVSNTVTIGGLAAGTTYDVYVVHVSDIGGESAISSQADKATASSGIAPPAFTASVDPAPSLNGYEIDYEVDQDAELLAIACLPGLGNPDATEIQAQTCDGGVAHVGFQTTTATANTPGTFTLPVTDALPRHDVHIVAIGTPDGGGGGDTLEVYPADVSGHTSTRYTCTVEGESSPVLWVVNNWGEASNADNSEENHWTQFSASAWPKTVVCTATTAEITSAVIRPANLGITPSVDSGADSVTFDVDAPGQFFVKMNGMDEYPLFVFASEIDANKPVINGTTVKEWSHGMDMTGVTTVVFRGGYEYDLDPDYPETYDAGAGECNTTDNTDCVFTPLQVDYGIEYYIEGGAWVDGAMHLDTSGSGTFKLRGRGTLTGEQYRPNKEEQSYRMLYVPQNDTNGNMVLEGITVALTPRQFFVGFDSGFTYTDMKVMSFTGDAVRMTNGSLVQNSFFKVNDDAYKPFTSNTTALNNIVWLQKTGVAVLFSWSAASDVNNILIDGLDVIESDRATYSGTPGVYTQADRAPCITNTITGVQNIDGGAGGAHISDVVMRNVRWDVPMWMVMQFKNKGCLTGWTDGQNSEISEFTFENWSGPAASEQFALFNGNGTNPGTIHDFHFINVEVGGVDLDAGDIGDELLFCTNETETCVDNSATFTFAP